MTILKRHNLLYQSKLAAAFKRSKRFPWYIWLGSTQCTAASNTNTKKRDMSVAYVKLTFCVAFSSLKLRWLTEVAGEHDPFLPVGI